MVPPCVAHEETAGALSGQKLSFGRVCRKWFLDEHRHTASEQGPDDVEVRDGGCRDDDAIDRRKRGVVGDHRRAGGFGGVAGRGIDVRDDDPDAEREEVAKHELAPQAAADEADRLPHHATGLHSSVMRRVVDSIVAAGLALTAIAGDGAARAQERTRPRVLVVNVPDVNHPTSGPAGVVAIKEFAAVDNYDVDECTDYGLFTDQYLARYDAMVWTMAAPLTWTETSRAAFERFVKSGKGWVGLHVAALTGISKTPWTWFEDYVGGLVFRGHPARQTATVRLDPAAASHPVLRGVDPVFRVWDEWYSWDKSPRSRQALTVLATLDESSYNVGKLAMGDHPIAWVGEQPGRMMVAGFGHDPSVYRDPSVRQLLRNAITWVMAPR